jgi:hypothetical protein
VFDALLAALNATGAPTLLVFEDVHWADEATLDLLRFVGRRIVNVPALVVATYRDDEVGPVHPLRIVLGDLATFPGIRRVKLEPLSPAGVRELADFTDVDPDDLFRRTGGNPFFVTEVLAAGTREVPPNVRDAVLARAARLPPDARAVLDAAAVIGGRIEPWLIDGVSGAPPGGRSRSPVRLAKCSASGRCTPRVPKRHALQAARAGYDLADQHGQDTYILAELACWRTRVGDVFEPPSTASGPFALELCGDWRGARAQWLALGCPYEAAIACISGDEAARRDAAREMEALGASRSAAALAR